VNVYNDQSFGIVPLQKENAIWKVFLVRHKSGHWTLPKGHPELDETPLETAKRELFEETGLTVVQLFFTEPLIENYQFTSRNRPIHKQVDYYIAEVTGNVKIQEEEIQEGRWVDLANGQDLATYPQMKALLQRVLSMLGTV
jgi:8-oxo-dGTP pyrophosphatase MutT (NUDIX family)